MERRSQHAVGNDESRSSNMKTKEIDRRRNTNLTKCRPKSVRRLGVRLEKSDYSEALTTEKRKQKNS